MPHHAAIAEGCLGEQKDSELNAGRGPRPAPASPGQASMEVKPHKHLWYSTEAGLVPSLSLSPISCSAQWGRPIFQGVWAERGRWNDTTSEGHACAKLAIGRA